MKLPKLCLLMTCLVFLTSLAGCNTMHGAGQDIAAGGNALQNASDKNQQNSVKYH